MDGAVLAGWHARMAPGQGVFRNTIADTLLRPLPHPRVPLVAQFNSAQASNKRREVTSQSDARVVQPVDPARFNFNKARGEEVLFTVRLHARDGGRLDVVEGGEHKVLVNVSPLALGHVVLVPHALAHRPQVLDKESLAIAMAFARSSQRPDFRVLFNSLGAWASVNHLHLHGLYVEALPSRAFPVERMPRHLLHALPDQSLRLSTLPDFPLRVLVLCATPRAHPQLANAVAAGVAFLQAANIPHNLMLADHANEVYVVARQPQVDGPGGVCVAVVETCGLLVFKDELGFERTTHDQLCAHLRDQVSVDAHVFKALAAACWAAAAPGQPVV